MVCFAFVLQTNHTISTGIKGRLTNLLTYPFLNINRCMKHRIYTINSLQQSLLYIRLKKGAGTVQVVTHAHALQQTTGYGDKECLFNRIYKSISERSHLNACELLPCPHKDRWKRWHNQHTGETPLYHWWMVPLHEHTKIHNLVNLNHISGQQHICQDTEYIDT